MPTIKILNIAASRVRRVKAEPGELFLALLIAMMAPLSHKLRK